MILRLQTGLCRGLGSARPWGCIPQTRELLQWHRLRGFCALPPFTALLGARMITETLLGKAGTEPPQREELGAAWHRVPKFTPSRKNRCSGERTSKIPVLAGGRHRVGPAVTPAQGALLSPPPRPQCSPAQLGLRPSRGAPSPGCSRSPAQAAAVPPAGLLSAHQGAALRRTQLGRGEKQEEKKKGEKPRE